MIFKKIFEKRKKVKRKKKKIIYGSYKKYIIIILIISIVVIMVYLFFNAVFISIIKINIVSILNKLSPSCFYGCNMMLRGSILSDY